MSAPTAMVTQSTPKRNREPFESSSPFSAERLRSEDLTSLNADAREISECASPPSEETSQSKISSPPVEGVSLERDGQKPPAATADTTTADTTTAVTTTAVTTTPMSESTLRIIAHHEKTKAEPPGTRLLDWDFWGSITLDQYRRYFIETGQSIRTFLLSAWTNLIWATVHTDSFFAAPQIETIYNSVPPVECSDEAFRRNTEWAMKVIQRMEGESTTSDEDDENDEDDEEMSSDSRE